MTLYICPAGTSIMGGPFRPTEFAGIAEQIAAKLERERTAARGSRETFLVRASAETNGLFRSGAGADDRVVFLASDTDDGRACADRLCSLVEAEFRCRAQRRVIQGLQMNDGRRFQQQAIDALFNTLDELTRDELPADVRINATGGFKGTLPYLVLYGMTEGVEVVYVYEWSNALIRLPPLPIRFDWARLAGAAAAIFAIVHDGTIAEERWRAMLPRDYYARQNEYDVCFLFEDGLVSLSGAGHLLKRKLEASQAEARILLSPEAAEALRQADGRLRRDHETILARARNPLARRAGRHMETLTTVASDLLVWKTIGRANAPRMLYWEDAEDVLVAGLMPHDDYDAFWKRNPKRRGDYRRDQFVAWDGDAAPDYRDLADVAQRMDLGDPQQFAQMQEELARLREEYQSARAQLNQAHKRGLEAGLQQGRAEGRRHARLEAMQELEDARRAAASALQRAAAAEQRVAELNNPPQAVGTADLQQRMADLTFYVGLLEAMLEGNAG